MAPNQKARAGRGRELMGLEAAPGKFGEVVTQHRNTEQELATIERCRGTGDPQFDGEYLLCFYDESSPVVAPMLLDKGTVTWLRKWMERVSLHTEPLPEVVISEEATADAG